MSDKKTLKDWMEEGSWDAGHAADQCNVLPYTPLDLAVWSIYYKVPPEVLVELLVRHPVNSVEYSDWFDIEQPATIDEYWWWLAGYQQVACAICTGMVQSFQDQVGAMSDEERMMYCLRIQDRFPSLLTMWHEPTIDDIPVLT